MEATGINSIQGAVGELLGLINGYSYVGGNPVNRVDPSGMCAQPTQWWNPVDANCYYSAVGLAQRFSQDNPQAYNAWFDVLIQKDWGELQAIEALGTVADVTGGAQQLLDNALIIPDLLVQNPQVLLQSLNQYLFGCGNSTIGLSTVAPFGRSPQLLLYVAGGITVAGVILAVYAALRQAQSSSGSIAQPYFTRPSGPRITWEHDYQAARDATGACLACATASVLNPKFCNVNLGPGHGMSGDHVHIYRFHQDSACYCRIQPDDPFVIPLLSGPYAGPPGGPYFPATTPPGNPELAQCTGGWMQT